MTAIAPIDDEALCSQHPKSRAANRAGSRCMRNDGPAAAEALDPFHASAEAGELIAAAPPKAAGWWPYRAKLDQADRLGLDRHYEPEHHSPGQIRPKPTMRGGPWPPSQSSA
jgi:hypothetical protein